MGELLDPLQYAILPVFAFPALGFYLGRRRLFSVAHAEGANQYVIEIAVPCITFYLLARANLTDIDWPVVGTYIAINCSLFAYTYLFTQAVFGMDRKEAILLGVVSALPNHVFFSLPIGENAFGAEAMLPMGAMIAADALILFSGAVMLLEINSGREGARAALGGILRNRILQGTAAGLAFSLAGLEFHAGFERFLILAAASGAPPALFALGVVLANANLTQGWGPARMATVISLVVAPVLGWVLLGDIVPASDETVIVALLALGGPSASTGFIIGLKYGINVEATAKATIMTTALSVFTIALIL